MITLAYYQIKVQVWQQMVICSIWLDKYLCSSYVNKSTKMYILSFCFYMCGTWVSCQLLASLTMENPYSNPFGGIALINCWLQIFLESWLNGWWSRDFCLVILTCQFYLIPNILLEVQEHFGSLFFYLFSFLSIKIGLRRVHLPCLSVFCFQLAPKN